MWMSEKDFAEMCANKNIKATVQAGAGAGKSVAPKPAATDGKKKPPKYRNVKVYVYKNGYVLEEKNPKFGKPVMVFDSRKEYDRHEQLKLLEKAGAISGLRRQVPFLIQEACDRNGEHINAITYVADFCYHLPSGEDIVEDVKGQDAHTGKYITTKDFQLKWKLLKYRYQQYVFRIF